MGGGHTTAHGHDAHGEHVGHVVPIWLLAVVLIVLLFLTWITVVVRYAIDLGPFNIWIAMAIATVKAALVCLYFMHLRWDRTFNAIVLVASLLFVMLFIGLALVDTHAYDQNVRKFRETDPRNYAPLVYDKYQTVSPK